jgi:SAM-dependent methyltransferase
MAIEEAIRARLHDHSGPWLAATWAKRAKQGIEISRYLASHESPRITLGAGPHRRNGWLSTDVNPTAWAVYLDVTRPFPIPEASIDYFHAEHLIEHIGYHAALRMAKEMRRTLKPGGVARVATPDLGNLAALLSAPTNGADAYVERANTSWAMKPEAKINGSMPVPYYNRSSFVLNRLFYGWGHSFVFDRDTLADLLELAGFTTLRWYAVGESDDPALRSIESHAYLGQLIDLAGSEVSRCQ